MELLKTVNYRKRNKWMGGAVLLALLLCWLLSFSKTWSAYRKNRELKQQMEDNYTIGEHSFQVGRKYAQLDTLIQVFSADSISFDNSFLQNVSLAIAGIPVQLSYDATKKADAEDSIHLLYGDITLEGGYKNLVRAIERLERTFFVNRVNYKDGICVVRLTKVKIK